MGITAICAVLDHFSFFVPEIFRSAQTLFQTVHGTITKQAVKVFPFHVRMAGIIFTCRITEKTMTIFHIMLLISFCSHMPRPPDPKCFRPQNLRFKILPGPYEPVLFICLQMNVPIRFFTAVFQKSADFLMFRLFQRRVLRHQAGDGFRSVF